MITIRKEPTSSRLDRKYHPEDHTTIPLLVRVKPRKLLHRLEARLGELFRRELKTLSAVTLPLHPIQIEPPKHFSTNTPRPARHSAQPQPKSPLPREPNTGTNQASYRDFRAGNIISLNEYATRCTRRGAVKSTAWYLGKGMAEHLSYHWGCNVRILFTLCRVGS